MEGKILWKRLKKEWGWRWSIIWERVEKRIRSFEGVRREGFENNIEFPERWVRESSWSEWEMVERVGRSVEERSGGECRCGTGESDD